MKRQSEALIPINQGKFHLYTYADSAEEKMPHLALVSEKLKTENPVFVRIHSECLTGDLFGSKRCDCGEQLSRSLDIIGKENGVLIYLRQEGRGIGLINKLKAYQLQDTGMNTLDANLHLGFDADSRIYEVSVQILQDLEINSINLITNSPDKIKALQASEIEVNKRIPVITEPLPENKGYLDTKKDFLGHLI